MCSPESVFVSVCVFVCVCVVPRMCFTLGQPRHVKVHPAASCSSPYCSIRSTSTSSTSTSSTLCVLHPPPACVVIMTCRHDKWLWWTTPLFRTRYDEYLIILQMFVLEVVAAVEVVVVATSVVSYIFAIVRFAQLSLVHGLLKPGHQYSTWNLRTQCRETGWQTSSNTQSVVLGEMSPPDSSLLGASEPSCAVLAKACTQTNTHHSAVLDTPTDNGTHTLT